MAVMALLFVADKGVMREGEAVRDDGRTGRFVVAADDEPHDEVEEEAIGVAVLGDGGLGHRCGLGSVGRGCFIVLD